MNKNKNKDKNKNKKNKDNKKNKEDLNKTPPFSVNNNATRTILF